MREKKREWNDEGKRGRGERKGDGWEGRERGGGGRVPHSYMRDI